MSDTLRRSPRHELTSALAAIRARGWSGSSLSTEDVRSQQAEAAIQLYSIFECRSPAPLMAGWAMEPISILNLVGLVLDLKPSLIVECGSGVSTLWLRRALRRNGNGCLISLEHSRPHFEAAGRLIDSEDLRAFGEVLYCPLVEYSMRGDQYPWYDLSHSQLPDGPIDMLLVDGPPGALGRYARYPALPLLGQRLNCGAIVVLDDVDRKPERIIARDWLSDEPSMRSGGAIGPRTRALIFART